MASVSPVANLNNNKIMGNLDPNVYATKKTIAQGLLDVALLTANASQLKYLLQVGKEHEFYHVMMVLISFSIILQVLLMVFLVLNSRFNINHSKEQRTANILNNIETVAGLIILVVNIVAVILGYVAFGHEFPGIPRNLDNCTCPVGPTDGTIIIN